MPTVPLEPAIVGSISASIGLDFSQPITRVASALKFLL
jgi:hypothetical protein